MSSSPNAEVDPVIRARAEQIAERLTEIAFVGRKGHGDGPCSYRQMGRADLMALLIVAFENGADWKSRR